MEINESGYFIKLINDLREKEDEPEALFDIRSSEELRSKALKTPIFIAYIGVDISEYSRIIDQEYIRKWTGDKSFGPDKIILEKVPIKEVNKIKFNRILRSIRYNLNELENLNRGT